MEKLGLLYFGRLEKEKGFDAILEMVQRFGRNDKELPFQLFVFGDGLYRRQVEDLSDIYDDVHYFGFQPLKQIFRYVENCHYCLMPSSFLETFGLSAVNALGWGLPVVAYKKGGLIPFVFEELDLGQFSGYSTVDHLEKFVQKQLNKKERLDHKKRLFPHALEIADKYHQVDWEKKVETLLDPTPTLPSKGRSPEAVLFKRKILMVTDFKTKIAGVETYVHDATRAMNGMGNSVKILGAWSPRGFLGKIWRYRGMFLSMFNIVFAIRLWIKIWRFKPDVVWFHSTIRWMGWLGYFVVKCKVQSAKSKVDVWQMFHDFGYFYPFPHKLTDVKELSTPLNMKNFLKDAGDSFIKKVFARGKYLQLALLKNFAKKYVDKFFVPSNYMRDIVAKSWQVDEKKIEVLEHFVQE